MLGGVDGVVVWPTEPAPSGQGVEVGLVVGEAAADPGDVAVEAGDLLLVHGERGAQGGEGRADLVEAAELGAAVGAGVGFDVAEGLLMETAEGFPVLARSSSCRRVSVAESSAEERCMTAVRTATGVGGG